MDRRKTLIGASLLLLVGAAWLFGVFGGADPAVAELEAMRDRMFAGRDLPDDERRRLGDQFRQQLVQLTEDQRRALFSAGREQWNQRAEQRMDEFFAMARTDQQKQLDEMINRMLQRRNERGRNADSANRQARSNGNGAPGGGADRRRGQNMTEAQRDARAKQRLDRSTPKQRAQRDEFRKRLQERMEQRGIPADSLRGRGGRGGWGRMA